MAGAGPGAGPGAPAEGPGEPDWHPLVLARVPGAPDRARLHARALDDHTLYALLRGTNKQEEHLLPYLRWQAVALGLRLVDPACLSDIMALFLPALVASLLEPVQQAAETAVVGRLGVAQLGAVGLGTVLFQFSLGFLASLIFATTPKVAAHAAKSQPDYRGASLATAHGMWVALLCGAVLQALVWAKAPDVITWMAPGDFEVAGSAVLYLRARSWGLPAALAMMVGIGSSRGVRDMSVQLLGSLAYLVALVGGDVLLVLGPPDMGVEGAGYAAAAAQWLGAAAVVALLARRRIFSLRDMASPPSVQDVLPYATMALSLGVNNVSALAPVLVATSLATGLGATHLAAHTILRQLMGFWLQGFVAFNATAHSLVATNLSRREEGTGAEVLVRIAQMAVAASLPVAAALYAARGLLPGLFTGDVVAAHEVAEVLPLLLLIMPLDAVGTVLEGGLLGASDTRWIAGRTAVSCAISLTALAVAYAGHGTLLAVWVGMKCVNLAALALDLGRFLLQGGQTTLAAPHRAAAALESKQK